MSQRTRVGALSLLIAGLLVIGPAAPQAHKKSFPTTMTAGLKNKNFFEGKLSTVPRCISGRSVSVFSADGTLLGSATTDAAGEWLINSSIHITAGTYSAVLKPRVLFKNKRHRHICRGFSVSVPVA